MTTAGHKQDQRIIAYAQKNKSEHEVLTVAS
jgi:hypothetical protein